MRPIDADALIKELNKGQAEPAYQHHGEDWYVGMITAEELVYEQPTITLQQWRPCSERLPEEKEASYWICTDGGYQCQVRWTEDAGFGKHGNWRWHHMDYPQYSKVIAWMPLPKPYQEGTDK